MRKLFKKFSKATRLHHFAAFIQEKRRQLLRNIGKGVVNFRLNDEISFKVDISARTPFRMFNEHDPDMQLEIQRFIELGRSKNCFLDIGSLHGIFSLSFCSINPTSAAYSIEPSPKGFDVLNRNATLNNTMNIHPVQIAFGAKEGQLKMHYEWIHLIANHNGNNSGHSIPMTTLDHFIDLNGIIPDIIKIDVDGFEGDVISGARSFLKNHDPLIFLELHGEWIKRYNHLPLSIAHELQHHGYHFFDLNLCPIQKHRRGILHICEADNLYKGPSEIIGLIIFA